MEKAKPGIALVLTLLAKSHIYNTASTAGAAVTNAEVLKRNKYAGLGKTYLFEPITIETTGVYGRSPTNIICDISRRLVASTGDIQQLVWFKQQLSLAVQQGDAISILVSARYEKKPPINTILKSGFLGGVWRFYSLTSASKIGGYCFHPFLFVCLLLTKSKDFVSILMTSGLCLCVCVFVCLCVCVFVCLCVCVFVCFL